MCRTVKTHMALMEADSACLKATSFHMARQML